MVTYCNPIYGYADQIVTGGWYQFQGFAQNAYDLAIEALEDLSDFTVDEPILALSYNFDQDIADFSAPVVPDREIPDFESPDAPADVTINEPILDLSDVPPLPDAPVELVYSPPDRPDINLPTAPDVSVTLIEPEMPLAPDYTLPELPTFYELELPEPPVITIPEFDVERPDFEDIAIDDAPFVFNEVAYASDQLDAIKARLTVMLEGGTGLSAQAEQALFDRATSRDDQLTDKAISEVFDDFAARGWEVPSGILAKRLDRTRQEAQNRSATTGREIYIQAQTIAIDNLKFAIAQGIALEEVLLNAHLAVQERAFQVLRYAREATIQIINAKIARANLQAQIYATEAQVFRDRIQAELAKAEVYKTELEAQRLIGEMNSLLVQQYEAHLRGVLALTDIYKTELEGVRAQLEINVQRIEAKKAEVQVFIAQTEGYEAAWRGFAAQVEGELGTVRMNEVAANTYLARINGVRTMNEVAIERQRNEVAVETLKISKLDALLRKYAADISAESARIDASVRALQAEAQVYSAAGDVAQAQSATADRALQLNLERTRADADLQLRRGEITISATLQRAAILQRAMESVGQIAAQLSASSMSAVNLSASISSNQGNSTSCNTSYSLSGDI